MESWGAVLIPGAADAAADVSGDSLKDNSTMDKI